jgi:hypothetical protein
MTLRAMLIAVVVLLVPSLSQAQSKSLKGHFQDPISRAPVAGVKVTLTNMGDTTDVHHADGKDDGGFEITGLGVHSYRLEAARLGYAPLKQIIRVTEDKQDAGVLALTPESLPVGGISVVESPPPATQVGDTTEYRAGAVKTHKDATAEDLVQKLPGVTMENGQIRSQGEQVQNVLVNGRPFFGSDPTAAMRNLPADVVDRIQVYDRMSDQSEFSGFDDGTSQRTMNFILKDMKMNFGKVYGGGGDQDRYQAGGNATVVHGGRRITGIAMSNNINQRNFSPQDLFGALGGGGGGGRQIFLGGGGNRGPGGGGPQVIRFGGGGGGFGGGAFDPSSFLIGGQTGISQTHSGGVNYTDQWGKHMVVTGSVFANLTNTDNEQTMTRQYVPPPDSLAFYDQSTTTDSQNRNQRVDARFEWTPDSANAVILQPRMYFQGTDANVAGTGVNSTVTGSTVSAASANNHDSDDGDNLSARMTLRHRFARRGRNISAEINGAHAVRNGNSSQLSLTDSYAGDSLTGSDPLDQTGTSRTETQSFSTRLAYTEPLGKLFRAQAVYNPSVTTSHAAVNTRQFDPLIGADTLNLTLSNAFENRYETQNGGLAGLFSKNSWRLLGNAFWQRATLRSDQTFPATQTIERTFDDFLPSMTLTGNFSRQRNLRLAWTTAANAPSITQLQNVVKNTNPLSLSTGNPNLIPSYNNSLSMRLSEANPKKSTSHFLFANVVRTSHPIVNSTITAANDTVVNGVPVARGAQLTYPVNLDYSWNANLYAVASRPIARLKSIINLNGGGTYARTPTLIENHQNVAQNGTIRAGVVVSSNISQNLDFTVSYFGNWNMSRNTLSTSNTGDYFSSSGSVRLNATVGPGIVLREEVNHNLQTNVPSAYESDVVLFNSSIGKKFLKDGRGDLRLTVTDVLEQNESVSRTVTESYVQDSRDLTLHRYTQLVFTYSFRNGVPGTQPGGGGFMMH